ncbi:MAG: sensor histidine kinase [Bryobacteraceae bacterium]
MSGQELLEKANQRLERSNRDLLHFASVVAHELKSPLSTISAMSTWLCEEYESRLDSEAQEYLEFMNKAVCRMNMLVDAVFQYSKADAARQLAVEQVNAGEILRWALANLHSEIRASRAVITFDPLPEVQGGENELAQIFQNLVSNAIRYSKPGQTPRVQVTASESEQEWTFSIADNGIGIEPQHSERIFNLFERLNPEGPGIGLGLSICRKVVEKHGGRIWVESKKNKGSTFRFTLPK